MLRQSLERLVRLSLEPKLGRTFQAEGTAWAKYRGPLQHRQCKEGPEAVQLYKRGHGRADRRASGLERCSGPVYLEHLQC